MDDAKSLRLYSRAPAAAGRHAEPHSYRTDAFIFVDRAAKPLRMLMRALGNWEQQDETIATFT